ncbi:MAG: thioredoxin fold domain-containing protein [Nitrospirota bacterium]|nr:MAG: thioredoxin fold domain-containing protein [Nitrospirota bacterium]
MSKRNDIAFYLKMFPLTSIHPQAYDKAKAILCEESNDNGLKLLEDTYAKREIAKPACNSKIVDESIKLATDLGLTGTPAIILPDGRIKSGAMKAEELIKVIDEK